MRIGVCNPSELTDRNTGEQTGTDACFGIQSPSEMGDLFRLLNSRDRHVLWNGNILLRIVPSIPSFNACKNDLYLRGQ